MHCTWARSLDPSSGASPSTISPVRNARATSGRATSSTTDADEVHRVHGLAGRRAHLGEHHERLPSSPTTGASSRRSEKQRSASACHDAASRWT